MDLSTLRIFPWNGPTHPFGLPPLPKDPYQWGTLRTQAHFTPLGIWPSVTAALRSTYLGAINSFFNQHSPRLRDFPLRLRGRPSLKATAQLWRFHTSNWGCAHCRRLFTPSEPTPFLPALTTPIFSGPAALTRTTALPTQETAHAPFPRAKPSSSPTTDHGIGLSGDRFSTHKSCGLGASPNTEQLQRLRHFLRKHPLPREPPHTVFGLPNTFSGGISSNEPHLTFSSLPNSTSKQGADHSPRQHTAVRPTLTHTRCDYLLQHTPGPQSTFATPPGPHSLRTTPAATHLRHTRRAANPSPNHTRHAPLSTNQRRPLRHKPPRKTLCRQTRRATFPCPHPADTPHKHPDRPPNQPADVHLPNRALKPTQNARVSSIPPRLPSLPTRLNPPQPQTSPTPPQTSTSPRSVPTSPHPHHHQHRSPPLQPTASTPHPLPNHTGHTPRLTIPDLLPPPPRLHTPTTSTPSQPPTSYTPTHSRPTSFPPPTTSHQI